MPKSALPAPVKPHPKGKGTKSATAKATAPEETRSTRAKTRTTAVPAPAPKPSTARTTSKGKAPPPTKAPGSGVDQIISAGTSQILMLSGKLGDSEAGEAGNEQIMREFAHTIQVNLKSVEGKDLTVEEIAEACVQAVTGKWASAPGAEALTQPLMALALAVTHAMVAVAKMEEKATEDSSDEEVSHVDKRKKTDGGGTNFPAVPLSKKEMAKAKKAEEAEAKAKAAAAAKEAAKEAKEAADVQKTKEADKKRKGLLNFIENAEPKQLKAFMRLAEVAAIAQAVLPDGNNDNVMHVFDACNFEQKKKLLGRAAHFEFGHKTASVELDTTSVGSKSDDEDDEEDEDASGGAGGHSSGGPIFTLVKKLEAGRATCDFRALAEDSGLKSILESFQKAAVRGKNARKTYHELLAKIQVTGGAFSVNTYKAMHLMESRSKEELMVGRSAAEAEAVALAKVGTLIVAKDWKVVDLLDMHGSSARLAVELACEPLRYGGLAVGLEKSDKDDQMDLMGKDFVLGMQGNPFLLETCRRLGIISMPFGQVLVSAKANMGDLSEHGLLELLMSELDQGSASYLAAKKMQALANEEGEPASNLQMRQLPIMRRSRKAIKLMIKVVYEHFPTCKRAAIAAALGMAVTNNLMPVSKRGIQSVMDALVEIRGVQTHAPSLAFISTDPLDAGLLARLEAIHAACAGKETGARQLPPAQSRSAATASESTKVGHKAPKVSLSPSEEDNDGDDDNDDTSAVAGAVSGQRGAEPTKEALMAQKGQTLFATIAAHSPVRISTLLGSRAACYKLLTGGLATTFEKNPDAVLPDKACPSCYLVHLVGAPCALVRARKVVIEACEIIKPTGFVPAKEMLDKPPKAGETYNQYIKRVDLRNYGSSSTGSRMAGAKRVWSKAG